MRMKLTACGSHIWPTVFILFVAAAGRSLCAVRYADDPESE
jgi:hypothetical protein